MDRDEILHKRLRIYGQVQGVWFRGSTQEMANKLGVSGWVTNKSDGSVEAELHGPVNKVEALVEWCRTGPPSAKVEQVEITSCPPIDNMKPGFHVIR